MRSTAIFGTVNLCVARRSLPATLCATKGAVSASASGPEAAQQINASHARRLLFFVLKLDIHRARKAVRNDKTRCVSATTILRRYREVMTE